MACHRVSHGCDMVWQATATGGAAWCVRGAWLVVCHVCATVVGHLPQGCGSDVMEVPQRVASLKGPNPLGSAGFLAIWAAALWGEGGRNCRT